MWLTGSKVEIQSSVEDTIIQSHDIENDEPIITLNL